MSAYPRAKGHPDMCPTCHAPISEAQRAQMQERILMNDSLIVLKEEGSMTLQQLTYKTALRLGEELDCERVNAVMYRHKHLGEARIVEAAEDFREAIWSVT